jgi:alkanesulfonate monooxygenase SsuD/methylene tetrahydromethanopterin reductase-like flavin-dependent oxidoreductase (luciferase family)
MARSETTKPSPGNDAAIDQLGCGRSEGIRAQRTQRTKERSMNIGMMMVFASYGWENCPDTRVWDEEIRLARLAADLGFDCLWSAEHHFNDYSFVPDNLQLMTYLTALCPGVDLGTAAVIVPWHDPLRVAEQAAVLDMLSKGRLRLGLGRGLARREFAAFRLSMDESRERFDEAAPMIVNALNTGFIEGDGKFYKQPRIEIRPRPQYSFHGRIYASAPISSCSPTGRGRCGSPT